MNPELIKLCFPDEGMFWKVKGHKLLFSGVLNMEAQIALRIGGSGIVFLCYGFLNPECITCIMDL